MGETGSDWDSAESRRVRGLFIRDADLAMLLVGNETAPISSRLPPDLRVVGMSPHYYAGGFVIYCWSSEFNFVPFAEEAPVDLEGGWFRVIQLRLTGEGQ